jgi:hypothetical protein
MTARSATRKAATRLLLLAVFLALAASLSGCLGTPQNADWATPTTGAEVGSPDNEVKDVLEAYGNALADRDRDRLASVLDPESPDFVSQQLELLGRLQEVPFAQYQVTLTSQTDSAPDTVTAKVDISYRFEGSFSALADPDRAAFTLVKREDGWKLSGDATMAALGKQRDAKLWDLGSVRVLTGEHTLVLYHPGNEAIARQAQEETDAAYPRLESTLPGTRLPRVPIEIFDDKAQIDQAFPGQWQEWTGGASRILGSAAEQGGEIIIEGDLYNSTNSTNPGYNRTMVAHELTHVALFPLTGGRTPPFLIEGLADYVAGEDTVVLLKDQLRRGGSYSPTLRDLYQPSGFSILLNTESATLAYEEADTAVAYLEQRYGNTKVLELLKEFISPDESLSQDQLVDDAWQRVLGASWNQFEQDWQGYVLSS